MSASGIHIKPANRGKLHRDMGKPQGQKLSVADVRAQKAKHCSGGSDPNPAKCKRATFALNAKTKFGK